MLNVRDATAGPTTGSVVVLVSGLGREHVVLLLLDVMLLSVPHQSYSAAQWRLLFIINEMDQQLLILHQVFIASSLLLSSALAAVVPVAPGYAPAPAPYHPAPAPYHEEKLSVVWLSCNAELHWSCLAAHHSHSHTSTEELMRTEDTSPRPRPRTSTEWSRSVICIYLLKLYNLILIISKNVNKYWINYLATHYHSCKSYIRHIHDHW